MPMNTYTYFRNIVSYNYEETKDGLVIKVPLAGKKKEDVKLAVKSGGLTVKVNDHSYFIDVPNLVWEVDEYDVNKSKANMEHGLLTVTVPKRRVVENQIPIE